MTEIVWKKRSVLSVFVVVLCVCSLAGCSSLRKKFIRPPKGEKAGDAFVPVLEPVEYKKVEETPQQIYQGHYSMVRIYFKDLLESISHPDGGEKHERYIFTELLSHLDGMAAVLSDSKKAEAGEIHARIEKVLKEYDKPGGMRRYDIINGDMRRIERDIYRSFKPAAVAGAFMAKAS